MTNIGVHITVERVLDELGEKGALSVWISLELTRQLLGTSRLREGHTYYSIVEPLLSKEYSGQMHKDVVLAFQNGLMERGWLDEREEIDLDG